MFTVNGENPMMKSFPSAFQPPSSKTASLFSPGHNLFPRMSPSSSRSSPSPASHSKTDENCNNDPRLQLSSPDDTKHADDEADEKSPKRE